MAPRWDGIWVVAAVALAWRGLVELGPSGEEYALVAQMRAGAAPSHVFRPLADFSINALASATELRFAPLGFWLQGLLHAANALLLLALARALRAGRAASLGIAVLFGVGAGVADSLAWLAALNRPLSTLGALVALLGAVRFARPLAEGGGAKRDLVCLAAGFLWQFLVNEEVYGTALLLAVWLGLFAPLEPRRRWLLAGAPIVAVLLHFLTLRGSATGAAGRMELGFVHFAAGVFERHEHMGAGFGLSPLATWIGLAAALLALVVARRRRFALFGLGLLTAALVPFALDPGGTYRYYPSQAPMAMLLGGGMAVALAAAARRVGAWVWLVLPVAGFWASEAPRQVQLAQWREATAFVGAFDRLLRERPASTPRALLSLDSSVRGVLAARRPGVDAMGLPGLASLDTSGGFVRPTAAEPMPWVGPWIGRTFQGELAWIDEPASYFADRTELAAVALCDSAVPAVDLESALDALADPDFDPKRTAVVEAPAAVLAALVSGAEGQVVVLHPLTLDAAAGRAEQRLGVTCSAPMLLVVCESWAFGELWRFPKDQAVAQGVRERRVLVPSATDGASGAELATFRANAHGAAVLVPAGERTVVLRWRLASPAELR